MDKLINKVKVDIKKALKDNEIVKKQDKIQDKKVDAYDKMKKKGK